MRIVCPEEVLLSLNRWVCARESVRFHRLFVRARKVYTALDLLVIDYTNWNHHTMEIETDKPVIVYRVEIRNLPGRIQITLNRNTAIDQNDLLSKLDVDHFASGWMQYELNFPRTDATDFKMEDLQ